MPKAVNPTEKRAEFVAASWQVIASDGLKAATLRRVAQEAGCTTGALTHYFSDRQALLVDSLRAVHYRAGARMLEAISLHETPRERLAAVLRESLPFDEASLQEWRVWLAFWSETMNDPRLADENDTRYVEWERLLSQLVAPLIDDPSLAGEEVAHLISLVDGLGLRIARHRVDTPQLESARAECIAILDRTLAQMDLA